MYLCVCVCVCVCVFCVCVCLFCVCVSETLSLLCPFPFVSILADT